MPAIAHDPRPLRIHPGVPDRIRNRIGRGARRTRQRTAGLTIGQRVITIGITVTCQDYVVADAGRVLAVAAGMSDSTAGQLQQIRSPRVITPTEDGSDSVWRIKADSPVRMAPRSTPDRCRNAGCRTFGS